MAERHGAKLRFDASVASVDIQRASVTLTFNSEVVGADLIVAADGASSVVRPPALSPHFLS